MAANNLPPLQPGEMPMGGDSDEIPDMSNFQMPTKEELLSVLDSMDLSDAEKDELRAAILSGNPMMSPEAQWTAQGLILAFFLLIVVSIFAFFGYKLYKSLKDKEVKREEKRKLKQLKKKK